MNQAFEPQTLYKYLPLGGDQALADARLQRLLDVIARNRLWWSNPESFNDPFDCAPIFEMPSKRDYDRYRKSIVAKQPGINNRNDRRVRDKAFRNLPPPDSREFTERMRERLNNAAVCSLTTKPGNLLMWAHYANNHQGVCLGFSKLTDVGVHNPFVGTFPVKYQDDRPVIRVDNPGDSLVEMALLTKSRHWDYENEYRGIITKQKASLVDFPPGALKEIVFGSRMNDDEKREITTETLKRTIRPKFFQASLSETAFDIDLTPI